MNQKSREVNVAKTTMQTKSDAKANQQQQPSVIYVAEQKKSTNKRWLWFIATIMVVFIVIAIVWMNSISDAINALQNSIHHNSQAIANQQSELTGIKGQLKAISNTLNRLGQDIRTYAAQLMQALQHK